MEYNFRHIEKKWQQDWTKNNVYAVANDSVKPKYYVLDMFPYPSGAGLHVGHPLGYIASDIYARYKRLKGFNVLHPMGYDAFGLPAEQYALDRGIHPAISTEQNIQNFRAQLDKIGFCFDWNREVRTSDPQYYRWTQWIFLQLFESYFDRSQGRAVPIGKLVDQFERLGNVNQPCPDDGTLQFSAADWSGYEEKKRRQILMHYRLAYCGMGEVNWCEAMGTVLANDEVINGVSERGGYPVVKKKLRQWYLRITEYADRLLAGLQQVEFSEAMKEMQTNWIGKSYGAEISFALRDSASSLMVYTTRPDTIFGVDFMVIAPEHDLVEQITTPEQKSQVQEYVAYVKSRSERERMAEKRITGCFTGGYATHPFTGADIPIWISEYVLAGYGTGAIMAVPCGDERDFKFAKQFDLPITNIIGSHYDGLQANPTKDAILENSGFLNGLVMREAIEVALRKLEEERIGRRKANYRMRDAAFSRQRYWGEPFPIVWMNAEAYPLEENQLPLQLPQVDSYRAGPEGEGPLANLPEWTARNLETNTMPGYAGSSWYFLRYMDPHNQERFCDRKASDYWGQVDVYVGGTEHAVGHLLYSRMWTKVLYDLGYIGFDEPYKKLVNQGMIQGSSRMVYRLSGTNTFYSFSLYEQRRQQATPADASDVVHPLFVFDVLHVDVNLVDGVELDIKGFKQWRPEFASAEFLLENGKYICGTEVEKMSKSKFNTVNPDDLVSRFGADTFRMYEMFLGPVEQSKPWDTKGIEGVHRFLKKFWRLFFDEASGQVLWIDEDPAHQEWKTLHKAIRKVEEDTERFSFNTAVSALMIAVNELSDLKCHKKKILENLVVILAPYAPHITEELWHALGHEGFILDADYPQADPKYLVETSKDYPVAINGRTRTELSLSLDATQSEVEQLVLANDLVKKWLDGKEPKKIIYVKHKMINIVV
jgi:leucyl-tRNA synthetase